MGSFFDSQRHFAALAALYRADEEECLHRLLPEARLPRHEHGNARALAISWIDDIRGMHKAGAADLLAKFGLTSQEGLALMCLAEALLRIPDRATADALIRDKLGETHWRETLGDDPSWTLNAAGWALALTGKIVQIDTADHVGLSSAVGRLISRLGQPVIREALRAAMQWMADQFVTGETIRSALERVKHHMAEDIRYSFDMLGEGARTREDADRYHREYLDAISAVGEFQKTHHFARASGISVKLSALHPRYEMTQRTKLLREMVPQVKILCETAAAYNIPITIDAEEADRLQLSLEVIAEVLRTAQLGEWGGLGFAVQAYQKRAPETVDFFIDLARAHGRRFHLRLVKGAYWDTEIKRAQEKGWSDFPVFTRKSSTDVSYLACARKMLNATAWIDPVFGTHNAMTAAHISVLARENPTIEFQRLHGMGEELHSLIQKRGFGCCVYAPVGRHDVLLAYLVRRLLENGANSSFVNQISNPAISAASLTLAAADEAERLKPIRHPSVKLPRNLFLPERLNSRGLDLNDPFVTEPLLGALTSWKADIDFRDNVGSSFLAEPTPEDVDNVFRRAKSVVPVWAKRSVGERAEIIEKLGELLEKNNERLMAFLVFEGKKTVQDALSEIREAVDYCRYYAAQARNNLGVVDLPGPTGETNTLMFKGRGVFVCISPWNFPLAIFLGQIAAALVTGNSVIAKPAPQTPRVALFVAQLFSEAGLPPDTFQVCVGGAHVGETIVRHPDVAGVAFTGSTAAARAINRSLAAKDTQIVPLIAETGGQNALIIDSSALAEQVVDDVITSAFRSAGQRCSALRLLCVPETTADDVLRMLVGAVREVEIGDPSLLTTDVGPVIDEDAQRRLERHIARLRKEAKQIYSSPLNSSLDVQRSYVAPQIWEIPSVEFLESEVFGPILHVVRYKAEDLQILIAQINATGYGLTGGIHSRIETTICEVENHLAVGNLYVNRSLIGAVVGSQPFGGQGLSGTGPKAGGPHYLFRFVHEITVSTNTTAGGGNATLLAAVT